MEWYWYFHCKLANCYSLHSHEVLYTFLYTFLISKRLVYHIRMSAWFVSWSTLGVVFQTFSTFFSYFLSSTESSLDLTFNPPLRELCAVYCTVLHLHPLFQIVFCSVMCLFFYPCLQAHLKCHLSVCFWRKKKTSFRQNSI